MAHLILNYNRLQRNYELLDELFRDNGIEWGIVTKLLCGNKKYLDRVISLGTKEILDARIRNLKQVELLQPDIRKVYIKPPSEKEIAQVVSISDISLNTESYTIKLLSREAQRQNKIHRVIIMLELGDLREGVIGDKVIGFYKKVFEMPHIEVIGLGTNLNCLSGVEPTQDKLIQLVLYKKILEEKFHKKLPLISGGTSAMIPLLLTNQLPKEINHFRVGETLFFGNNLLNDEAIPGFHTDVFELYTQIIELSKKPMVPYGKLGRNVMGHKTVIEKSNYGKTSYRALIDIGELDINPRFLIPKDSSIKIIGATSDIIVLDLGINPQNYKTGDFISWNLKYMGVLHLMSSAYVEKRVVDAETGISKESKLIFEQSGK